jgi:hypothetical protein
MGRAPKAGYNPISAPFHVLKNGMIRALHVSMLVLIGLVAFAAGALAQPVFPPGSPIGLVPPGDLTVSHAFSGFADPGRHVAIVLQALPEQAYQALEKSNFAGVAKNLAGQKREKFPIDNGSGTLITGHQEVKGTDVHSWYLFANSSDAKIGPMAALIAVHVPQAALAVYSDKTIHAALKTVVFRKLSPADLVKLLPFKLKATAGFRVMKISAAGFVILIDGPDNDLSRHPYMIVSLGRGAPQRPADRARFAHDLLASAPLLNLDITLMDSIRIAGGPGYETRATATDENGKPLKLVQWLRFGGASTFLRVVGVAAKDRWDEMFPRFRAVRDGIAAR